jgi:hypothetical protein
LTDLILVRRLNILLKPITLTQMSIFFFEAFDTVPRCQGYFWIIWYTFDTVPRCQGYFWIIWYCPQMSKIFLNHLILSPDVKDIFESFDTVPRCQRYFWIIWYSLQLSKIFLKHLILSPDVKNIFEGFIDTCTEATLLDFFYWFREFAGNWVTCKNQICVCFVLSLSHISW